MGCAIRGCVDSGLGFLGGGRLSYSSTMSIPTPRGAREIGRRDGDRVFRAAARHSRFVRWMRRAIPAGIALIAAVIVIATFFNPFRLIGKFPIDIGKVSLSGTKITMEAPQARRLHQRRPPLRIDRAGGGAGRDQA